MTVSRSSTQSNKEYYRTLLVEVMDDVGAVMPNYMCQFWNERKPYYTESTLDAYPNFMRHQVYLEALQFNACAVIRILVRYDTSKTKMPDLADTNAVSSKIKFTMQAYCSGIFKLLPTEDKTTEEEISHFNFIVDKQLLQNAMRENNYDNVELIKKIHKLHTMISAKLQFIETSIHALKLDVMYNLSIRSKEADVLLLYLNTDNYSLIEAILADKAIELDEKKKVVLGYLHVVRIIATAHREVLGIFSQTDSVKVAAAVEEIKAEQSQESGSANAIDYFRKNLSFESNGFNANPWVGDKLFKRFASYFDPSASLNQLKAIHERVSARVESATRYINLLSMTTKQEQDYAIEAAKLKDSLNKFIASEQFQQKIAYQEEIENKIIDHHHEQREKEDDLLQQKLTTSYLENLHYVTDLIAVLKNNNVRIKGMYQEVSSFAMKPRKGFDTFMAAFNAAANEIDNLQFSDNNYSSKNVTKLMSMQYQTEALAEKTKDLIPRLREELEYLKKEQAKHDRIERNRHVTELNRLAQEAKLQKLTEQDVEADAKLFELAGQAAQAELEKQRAAALAVTENQKRIADQVAEAKKIRQALLTAKRVERNKSAKLAKALKQAEADQQAEQERQALLAAEQAELQRQAELAEQEAEQLRLAELAVQEAVEETVQQMLAALDAQEAEEQRQAELAAKQALEDLVQAFIVAGEDSTYQCSATDISQRFFATAKSGFYSLFASPRIIQPHDAVVAERQLKP